MRLTQRVGKRAASPRQGHQMDLVRHQTPAEQSAIVALAFVAQGVKIAPAILVEQENILAVVASLGDVMRRAQRHHLRLSRHGNRVAPDSLERAPSFSHITPRK